MTLEEIKNYLHVDYNDEDSYLNELIEVSLVYIDSMVGEAYKTDEKAVKLASLLQKKLISDMYENRGTEIASNSKRDIIVSSILDKLSLYGNGVI
ncbi:MAG: head-tail connector protein [Clostridium sp.]